MLLVLDKNLLFTFLGDPDKLLREEGVNWLDKMLDPEHGAVADCLSQLDHLLSSWAGEDKSRKPWAVLGVTCFIVFTLASETCCKT